MDGDEGTDDAESPTTGRSDGRPGSEPSDERRGGDPSDGSPGSESADSRRGFLRSLAVKAVATTTAASVVLSEDAAVPEWMQSPEERGQGQEQERKRESEQEPRESGDGIRDPEADDRGRELLDRPPAVRIPFDAGDAERAFTAGSVTDHNRIVDARDGAARSLRVTIPEGEHYGTSMHYRFDEAGATEPTALHSRYFLYVPTAFEFGEHDRGKLPGPAGTYGEAGWGGKPSDGTNGWSARMSFGSPDGDAIQLSSYVYHAQMDGTTGRHFEWDVADAGRIDPGRWYRIDNYVRMNAPGEDDGVLRGWVDGVLSLDEGDLRFRDVERLKVEEFWFDVYYGGVEPSPTDNAVEFRDLALWSPSWSGGSL